MANLIAHLYCQFHRTFILKLSLLSHSDSLVWLTLKDFIIYLLLKSLKSKMIRT